MKTALAVGAVLLVGGFIAYEFVKPYLQAGQAFKNLGGVAGDIRGITSDIRNITGSAGTILGGIKGWFGDSSTNSSSGNGDGGSSGSGYWTPGGYVNG